LDRRSQRRADTTLSISVAEPVGLVSREYRELLQPAASIVEACVVEIEIERAERQRDLARPDVHLASSRGFEAFGDTAVVKIERDAKTRVVARRCVPRIVEKEDPGIERRGQVVTA